MAGLVDRIVSAESGGNATARNPNSSAAGAGQFIDATWLDMLAKHRPDLTGSRGDLLALKMDPNLSRDMTAAYAAENGGILSKSGLPVTPGTQYLAHFAGPQGAVGLLNADPAAPAGSILGAGVVKANPFLANMTAGDVAAWADRKMGGAAPADPARSAAPMALAGPAAAPGAPSAPVAPEQPAAVAAQPAPAAAGWAPTSAASLDAMAAAPELQNLLRPRPKLALGRLPFSFGGVS